MTVVFVKILYTQQLELTIAHGLNTVSRPGWFIGTRRSFQAAITVQIMPTPPPSPLLVFPHRLIHTRQCPSILSCIFTHFLPLLHFFFPRISPLYRISSFPTFPIFSFTVSLSRISSFPTFPPFTTFSSVPGSFLFPHFFLSCILLFVISISGLEEHVRVSHAPGMGQ